MKSEKLKIKSEEWMRIWVDKNVVLDKSKEFAFRIIRLYQHLSEKSEYILSKQILRSGTSIGANLVESQYSISKKEFISKAQISLKETAETLYWLELLLKGEYIKDAEYKSMEKDCKEILFLLTAIIKSSKKSLKKFDAWMF